MARYECPIAVPDEHMRMVGIIAAQWEWIERVMEKAVAAIMEHEFARVGVLTANIGFQSKCDLILVYARPLETEDKTSWKRFTKAIKELQDAYVLRNTYVHASWKVTDDPTRPNRVSVRTKGGKLVVDDDPVIINDLNAAAKQIWDASERFGELLRDFGVLRP